MNWIDWAVLLGTLLLIVTYGVWKTRGSRNIQGFLLGNKQMNWWTIGLSVMATQASAITFLSTPGQAYESGMGFIQFYFGLPLAMILIAAVFIPLYYRLNVFTAYEFLEKRFDLKTRQLAAFLFLVQRGLAAGITIFAPAIVLSTILGWSLHFTNLFIGILVIIYTVSGGTRAVSQTHKHQMAVMMGGMLVALVFLILYLPDGFTLGSAVKVAGKLGKMNLIDTHFDPNNRYNIWSGLLGGTFLALSYFGTDQSQVQRYLSGISIKASRMGLIFNGFVKIPMQFLVLFTGVMTFLFFQFHQPPVHFNQAAVAKVQQSPYADSLKQLETAHGILWVQKNQMVRGINAAIVNGDEPLADRLTLRFNELDQMDREVREHVNSLIKQADPDAETRDVDYVFITFVINYLPAGLVGLLLAVMFSAAMSSTSAELNALASTTVVDIYKRSIKKNGSERHYLRASRWFTLMWGALAILFATLASLIDNLIQAVNILGSLFYGTILGIFLTAFFLKKAGRHSVFWAAVISELVVLGLYFFTGIGYLWFNLIGCVLVMILSMGMDILRPRRLTPKSAS